MTHNDFIWFNVWFKKPRHLQSFGKNLTFSWTILYSMNKFLRAADTKKTEAYQTVWNWNWFQRTNIFRKSFSHDLLKSWCKGSKKKLQQQNEERGEKKKLPVIYMFISFDFLSDIFRWEREKMPKINGKSTLFIQKPRWWITRYTIYNLAIKLVNMFVNFKLARTIRTCIWSVGACVRACVYVWLWGTLT